MGILTRILIEQRKKNEFLRIVAKNSEKGANQNKVVKKNLDLFIKELERDYKNYPTQIIVTALVPDSKSPIFKYQVERQIY